MVKGTESPLVCKGIPLCKPFCENKGVTLVNPFWWLPLFSGKGLPPLANKGVALEPFWWLPLFSGKGLPPLRKTIHCYNNSAIPRYFCLAAKVPKKAPRGVAPLETPKKPPRLTECTARTEYILVFALFAPLNGRKHITFHTLLVLGRFGVFFRIANAVC